MVAMEAFSVVNNYVAQSENQALSDFIPQVLREFKPVETKALVEKAFTQRNFPDEAGIRRRPTQIGLDRSLRTEDI